MNSDRYQLRGLRLALKSKLGTMSDEERREYLSRPVIVGEGLCIASRPNETEWEADTAGVILPPREETDAMFGFIASRAQRSKVDDVVIEDLASAPPQPPALAEVRDEPTSGGAGIVRN